MAAGGIRIIAGAVGGINVDSAAAGAGVGRIGGKPRCW